MLCNPNYRKLSHINRNYLKHRRRWIEQLGNRALWSQNVYTPTQIITLPPKANGIEFQCIVLIFLVFRAEIIFPEIVELPAELTVLAGVAYKLAIHNEFKERRVSTTTSKTWNYTSTVLFGAISLAQSRCFVCHLTQDKRHSLTSVLHLNNTYIKMSFRLLLNALRLYYKDQPVNNVSVTIHSLLWYTHGPRTTHTHTKQCRQNTMFYIVKASNIHNYHCIIW